MNSFAYFLYKSATKINQLSLTRLKQYALGSPLHILGGEKGELNFSFLYISACIFHEVAGIKLLFPQLMYQSIPAVPIPPPVGGAIAEIFQPGGGDLDIFHHGNWRTITWQISLEK